MHDFGPGFDENLIRTVVVSNGKRSAIESLLFGITDPYSKLVDAASKVGDIDNTTIDSDKEMRWWQIFIYYATAKKFKERGHKDYVGDPIDVCIKHAEDFLFDV